MKKIFLIMFVCYLHNAEAQNYYTNSNGYDHSFWFQQPQQPVLNYQYNTVYNTGNGCNGYNYNFAAREFGRSLGNLIVSIKQNKRWKRNRRNNIRNNNTCCNNNNNRHRRCR